MPRLARLTTLWLAALAWAFLSIDSLTDANTLASVAVARPRPIVLTTAKPPSPASRPKPKTPKPDGGDAPDISGGDSAATPSPNDGTSTTTNANDWVYYPCTPMDVALVINLNSADVQQCMAFSTYNFASGLLPTTSQRSLLCDTGCWPLINRLLITPIPYCSILLGGRAVNYIDALYTVFADCSSDPTKSATTNEQAVVTPTATTRSNDATSWRIGTLRLAALAVLAILTIP